MEVAQAGAQRKKKIEMFTPLAFDRRAAEKKQIFFPHGRDMRYPIKFS